MKYQLNNRKEVEDFVHNEVLTTSEVAEILGVTRQRISQLVSSGKLIAIKKLHGDKLFLRTDVEQKKIELEELRKKYRPYK
jgi:excisionase family DNA binding protein